MNIADVWYNWRVKRNLHALQKHWKNIKRYAACADSATNPREVKKYEEKHRQAKTSADFIIHKLDSTYGIIADTHYTLSDDTEFRILTDEKDVMLLDYKR